MSTLYFVENLVLNFTLEILRPKNEKEDERKFSPRESNTVALIWGNLNNTWKSMEVILPFCFFLLGIFKRVLLLLLASIRSVQTDVNRILLLASCSQITKMAVLF